MPRLECHSSAVRTSVTFTFYLLCLAFVFKGFFFFYLVHSGTVCLHLFSCASLNVSLMQHPDSDFGSSSDDDSTPSSATAKPHMITLYHVYLPLFFPPAVFFFFLFQKQADDSAHENDLGLVLFRDLQS